MKSNAIILHGKPTKERYLNQNEPKPHNANWLPWLASELEQIGIPTTRTIMPRPYFPVYEDWKKHFEAQAEVNANTKLVGHSAGAEFVLRWLSENGRCVERIVMVAPYLDFQNKYDGFSDYIIDSTIVKRVGSITIINSLDDDPPIQANVEHLMNILPGTKLINFEDYGHFRIGHNMTTDAFPELLDETIR